MSRRASYTEGEVRGIIEHYDSLRETADTNHRGLRVVVLLADLRRAMRFLDERTRKVVLLHGLLGYAQEDVASTLQISRQWVSKLYRRGVEELTYLMNGGSD